jgi:hypothetical protein
MATRVIGAEASAGDGSKRAKANNVATTARRFMVEDS